MKKISYSILAIFFIGVNILAADQTSYSLHDASGIPLDQKIVRLLNGTNGIFIEAGAHDGLTQSNTKRLEEYYGWTGILVEPSKNLFAALKANRPGSRCFQCALGSFEQDNSTLEGDFNGHLMSSVDGSRLNRSPTQKTLTRSLQSILDECGIQHVNFFSLDTEGYELNILQGIDFEKTTFDYLLIEIYSSQYDSIILFLKSKGYQLIENFSNYSLSTNPSWDGTHNDYLFSKTY